MSENNHKKKQSNKIQHLCGCVSESIQKKSAVFLGCCVFQLASGQHFKHLTPKKTKNKTNRIENNTVDQTKTRANQKNFS